MGKLALLAALTISTMTTQVRVSLKIGDINKSSRSSIRVNDDTFAIDVACTTFSEVEAIVNERLSNAISNSEIQG